VSQHISRKELKKDEFRETLVHGAEAALSHQRMIWIIGGTALAVLLLVFGWRFYSERQGVMASAGLDEAMKIFQARIRAAGEPEDPLEVTYLAEKNKFEDAAKKFSEVAANYPRTRQGRTARYYAGLSYDRLDKHDDAQRELRAVESSGDAELTALARLALAQSFERTGKGEDAVKAYRLLIEHPSTMVPRSIAMLRLAEYYRRSNAAEAAKLYEEIKKDYPDTTLAERAEERLAALKPKS